MALENLQSTYGPYNKRGQKGTGEVFDSLAFEGNGGLAKNFNGSKYAGTEGIGAKPTGPDPLGNIPAERSFE
jgi:hypothetical protein